MQWSYESKGKKFVQIGWVDCELETKIALTIRLREGFFEYNFGNFDPTSKMKSIERTNRTKKN